MNEKKIKERCCVLKKCIINLAEIYHDADTSEDQKRLIETMIGAAIWYLPSDLNLWTGKVSEEALKLIKSGKPISKLTKEHEFPRKLAAREALTSELENLKMIEDKLCELYMSKYGKFNYVTKNENTTLRKFQKDTNFVSPDVSYSKAGIKLVEIDRKLLQPRKHKGIERIE